MSECVNEAESKIVTTRRNAFRLSIKGARSNTSHQTTKSSFADQTNLREFYLVETHDKQDMDILSAW